MKYIAIILLSFCWMLNLSAQSLSADKVPSPVKDTYASMFKTATNATWQTKGSNYEATFTTGGVEMLALFAADGKFMQYEWNLDASKVPSTAMTYMTTHAPTEKIDEYRKIRSASGSISYRLSTTATSYFFDDKGNFSSSANIAK